MSTTLILLALAVLPVVVLLIYVYRKDKFSREPFGMLLKAFLFGCLAIVPAIFLELFLDSSYESIFGYGHSYVIGGLYDGFVVAGFSEELVKFLLLFLAVWWSRHFNEYFDGIVYSVFVSLGFACIENISYVLGQGDFMVAVTTSVMRMLLSVPGHFLFAVAMGYYFARAKFDVEKRTEYLLKALFVPVFLHGTFDALLMITDALPEYSNILSWGLYILFIYFDIKMWKAGMRRLRRLQMRSEVQFIENLPVDEEE